MDRQERKLTFKARNREETQARILSAAVEEFIEAGYLGARVERIAARSDVTLRMIYYYFKSKAYLYATVLQHVYDQAAESAREFTPKGASAEDDMRALVRFAFDHFAAAPELIQLDLGENLQKGDFLREAGLKRPKDHHLLETMTAVLEAGQQENVFSTVVEPLQLWLTIFALCRTHLSHASTLSWMHGVDLADADFVERRREHVERAVLATLRD